MQSWMGQSRPCWRSTLPETRSWPRLLDALMEIRAAKKAVDSTRAVTTLLNRLNRLSDNSREVKLQILEQSVTNSWKGIFPLKGGQAQTRKEPKRYVE